MNLDHLRYFLTLSDELHYTRAARELCITQPSLSHAIAQLERELEVQLIRREGRSIALTEAGRIFRDDLRRSLAILDDGVRAMDEIARGGGLVRLGFLRTLGTHFVPGLCANFLKHEQGKNVDFTFDSGITGELLDGLHKDKYDVAFTSPTDDARISFTPVSEQNLVLIVPSEHPLSNRHSIDLVETLEYPYVMFHPDSGLRLVIDGMFAKIDAAPRIAYEVMEDQVIAGLVASGFGIAVVPYMDILLRLDLRILQIANPVWERKFYMATIRERPLPPAAEHFVDFVRETSAV